MRPIHCEPFAETSDSKGFAVFKSRFGKVYFCCITHIDRLHFKAIIYRFVLARLFWRDAELVAKGAGEGFVRPVASRKRHMNDARGTIH